MSGVKNILASLYGNKFTGSLETLKREWQQFRSTLEDAGFVVARDGQGAQKLSAAKGNVILEVSELPWGGKTFSIVVGGRNRTRLSHMFTGSLSEAITFADAAQYLAK